MTEIIDKVEQLFLKYGIKSVTMDDIARELGKSKKTLYEHFKNKDDLVESVVRNHLEKVQGEIQHIKDEEENAVDSWIAISNYQVRFLQEFNSSIIFDLKKYYPKAWQLFDEHRREFIFNMMKENLERGVNEGLYRKNLKPEIIALNHIYKIEMFATPSTFHALEYNIKTIIEELIQYHLYGVASTEGRAYLKNKFNYEH